MPCSLQGLICTRGAKCGLHVLRMDCMWGDKVLQRGYMFDKRDTGDLVDGYSFQQRHNLA